MIDDEAVSVQDQSGSPPQMTSDPWRNVLDFSSGERAHTVITHTYIYISRQRSHTHDTITLRHVRSSLRNTDYISIKMAKKALYSYPKSHLCTISKCS